MQNSLAHVIVQNPFLFDLENCILKLLNREERGKYSRAHIQSNYLNEHLEKEIDVRKCDFNIWFNYGKDLMIIKLELSTFEALLYINTRLYTEH